MAGAKGSAMVYSLMLTCRACSAEPYAYLQHVPTELAERAPDANATDLRPFRYAEQMKAKTVASSSDRAGQPPVSRIACSRHR